MKRIYTIVFLFFLGCTTNKVYICGDHRCKDNNEIEEYFKNNISIEVYVVQKQKKSLENQDLVMLNLNQLKNDKEKKKELLFLKNRQIKKNTEKDNSKLNLKVIKEDQKQNKTKQKKVIKKNNSEKTFSYKNKKSTKIVHLCKNSTECDIDLISKKITELGKNKEFPDINFK